MMKRKKNKFAIWANEHPVLGSFIVVVLYVLFRRSTHFLFCSLLVQTSTTEAIHEIVDIIWPFLMVAAYEKLFIYKKGGFFHTLFLGTGLIIYGMIPFSVNMIDLLQDADIVWQSLPVILWNIAKTLFVGFREESCFRGIVVNLLSERYLKERKGIMFTVLLSAFIFGIMHFQNMFIGMSFAGSLIQSMNAFFVGLIFAAVYLSQDVGTSLILNWRKPIRKLPACWLPTKVSIRSLTRSYTISRTRRSTPSHLFILMSRMP